MLKLLLLACIISAALGDIGEDSCCPLVWKTLIKTSYGELIPPDAIEAGVSSGGVKQYFTRLPVQHKPDDWNWGDKIGFFSDLSGPSQEATCSYFEFANDIYCLDKRDHVLRKRLPLGNIFRPYKIDVKHLPPGYEVEVLSNPYNCDTMWTRIHDSNSFIHQTSEHHVPFIWEQYFARKEDGGNFRAGLVDFISFRRFFSVFYHRNMAVHSDEAVDGKEVLQINCRTSAKKIFNAELIDLDYNIDAITSKENSVLESVDYTNDSPIDLDMEINLQKTVTKSLKITSEHGTSSSHEFHINLSASSEFSVGFIAKAKFTMGIETGYRGTWDQFARTGKAEIETTTEVHGLKQMIKIPAHTKMSFSLITTPISGSVPFTSAYRFKWPQGDGASTLFTEDFVRRTLNRIGAPETDKLSKNSKGELILSLSGFMQVESGHKTQVVVKSTPIGNESNWMSNEETVMIIPSQLLAVYPSHA